MPDVLFGAGVDVIIDPPEVPDFRMDPPPVTDVIVVPVGGPEGPPGPAGTTDYTQLENLPDLSGIAANEAAIAGEIVNRGDAIATEVSDRDDAIALATTGMETTAGATAKVATETAARIAGDNTLTTALGSKADLVGGTVPANQLPSFVDDVLEFASLAAFPVTGDTGKIYVAKDTNLTYRWSGSAYGALDPSLALGETTSTAYRGDRGKTAYDHSQATGNPHGTTAAQVPNVPAGGISATDVQGALTELDTEKTTSSDVVTIATPIATARAVALSIALGG